MQDDRQDYANHARNDWQDFYEEGGGYYYGGYYGGYYGHSVVVVDYDEHDDDWEAALFLNNVTDENARLGLDQERGRVARTGNTSPFYYRGKELKYAAGAFPDRRTRLLLFARMIP